jgi:MraZ protein
MFRGISFHTIDSKGRIIVPARFRDVIKASGEDGIVVTRMDDCLFAYTHDRWRELEQKILDLPEKSGRMRRFERRFISAAQDCKCDAQGRILIPPFLKKYAELEKEIVLAGMLKRFEIWSRERWDQEDALSEQDMNDEQVQREIDRLGL